MGCGSVVFCVIRTAQLNSLEVKQTLCDAAHARCLWEAERCCEQCCGVSLQRPNEHLPISSPSLVLCRTSGHCRPSVVAVSPVVLSGRWGALLYAVAQQCSDPPSQCSGELGVGVSAVWWGSGLCSHVHPT